VASARLPILCFRLTQPNLDRHNRVSTTDTRLIRRIVRDTFERGYTAVQTIQPVGNRWRRGEKKYSLPLPGKCGRDVQLGISLRALCS